MIGISERDSLSGGTLYNTQLYIDRTGHILGKHRKLVQGQNELSGARETEATSECLTLSWEG